jgi:hypothetical protein
VENWFGKLKSFILQKRKDLMPSEYAGKMYEYLKCKYFDYFPTEKEPTIPTSGEPQELWKPRIKINREKGYYRTNKVLFKNVESMMENSSTDPNNFPAIFMLNYLFENNRESESNGKRFS